MKFSENNQGPLFIFPGGERWASRGKKGIRKEVGDEGFGASRKRRGIVFTIGKGCAPGRGLRKGKLKNFHTRNRE